MRRTTTHDGRTGFTEEVMFIIETSRKKKKKKKDFCQDNLIRWKVPNTASVEDGVMG